MTNIFQMGWNHQPDKYRDVYHHFQLVHDSKPQYHEIQVANDWTSVLSRYETMRGYFCSSTNGFIGIFTINVYIYIHMYWYIKFICTYLCICPLYYIFIYILFLYIYYIFIYNIYIYLNMFQFVHTYLYMYMCVCFICSTVL